MAKTSTSFQPGNKMWELGIDSTGRPLYWTEERLAEIINKLNEWAKLPDSICLAGFRGYNGITKDILTYLKKNSADFKRAYENAQQIVANRLASNIGNGVHQVHYNKYQAVYDPELKEHDLDMLLAKAKSEENRLADQQEDAKEIARMIEEQIANYRSERKIADNKSIKE